MKHHYIRDRSVRWRAIAKEKDRATARNPPGHAEPEINRVLERFDSIECEAQNSVHHTQIGPLIAMRLTREH